MKYSRCTEPFSWKRQKSDLFTTVLDSVGKKIIHWALATELRTTFWTKPNVWQTQKLLDPLFHHGMETSNAVFYATFNRVTGQGGVEVAVVGGHLV